jgi:OmpA-OmpF porin, OOP family
MRSAGGFSSHFVLLVGALLLPAASPARAQPAAATANFADQLAGLDTVPDLNVVALRQQAAERVRSKADPQPQKRPPIAAQLSKLPQFRLDVLFDPDTAIIRPQSYQLIGRIADALYDPRLLPYTFLIVDHTIASGRRDFNLALSQRRADSIRDALVTTFKISPKRLQAIGLGEEQLQDAARPTSPVNVRAQIMTVGKVP